jgi:archaemetzincin
MCSAPGSIGVVPIGEIDAIFPKVIAAHISGFLNIEPVVLAPLDSPSYAFDRERLQYNVAIILDRLDSRPVKGAEKIVGILSVDLFLPIFTHVFGEAKQGGNIALVSTFRLGGSPSDHSTPSSMVLERTAKVALHEACHLYGLTHCENRHCLMHFSGNLEELDDTPFFFCRYCRSYFRNAGRREK